MTTVNIGPPVVNVYDILDYAHALIQEYGWRQGARVPNSEEWDKVAENGLSLHDAIGMACFKLSGEVGKAAGRAASPSSKDFPTTAQYGYSGSLRTDAQNAVQAQLPSGQTDIQFNDAAKDAAEVLDVLDAAMKEAADDNGS